MGKQEEIEDTIIEKKVKEEAALEPETTVETKASEEKIEPEKEVLKSKAAISLPMTGATEAWMDDDDNFGGFSSSDDEVTPEDQTKKDDSADKIPEQKVREETAVESEATAEKKDEITYTIPATVEPETTVETKASEEKIEPEKEVLKSKAAISLPMTGATEAWMDDDDNFGDFSTSDEEITPEDQKIKNMTDTMPEEKVKEEAAVEPEATAEIKVCEEKNEPEKEVLKSKAMATEAWM